MKNITMVLGTGLNERGWADIVSRQGRVTLIQLGLFKHIEVWENGQRIYCGPQIKINYWLLKLDQMLLGIPFFFQTFMLILAALRGTKADLVLTGSYSSGLAAILLQKLGRVRRTVSFLADYLPPRGPLSVHVHRRITNWLTQKVAELSDEAWTLSPRIPVGKSKENYVVPIPVSHYPSPAGDREEVGYIGYPSADHALDILFEICKRHNFRLNIIGDSPYLQSIKHLAPPQTVFHGLLNDEARIGEVLARCFCGYAIYRDLSPNSYSYYGFPSKALYCFASNAPIVITSVADFNPTFEKRGVGRVVPPEITAIEEAILDLKNHYTAYSEAIGRFRLERNAESEAFHLNRFSALLRE